MTGYHGGSGEGRGYHGGEGGNNKAPKGFRHRQGHNSCRNRTWTGGCRQTDGRHGLNVSTDYINLATHKSCQHIGGRTPSYC